MEILDLEMTHFGKFHHKKLAFHSGLNVIYGENEAGKSTIQAQGGIPVRIFSLCLPLRQLRARDAVPSDERAAPCARYATLTDALAFGSPWNVLHILVRNPLQLPGFLRSTLLTVDLGLLRHRALNPAVSRISSSRSSPRKSTRTHSIR